MKTDEIWKEVPDNKRYLISNYGRCKSKITNKILKPNYVCGYIQYRLYYKNRVKPISWLAHRLVAITFINNPNNYPIINHINENRADNRVENLEWCTDSYNISSSTAHRENLNNISYERVVITDTENNILKTYNNYIIISKELNVPSWNIRQVCIRNRNNPFGKHTYRGVIYKFEKDVIQN